MSSEGRFLRLSMGSTRALIMAGGRSDRMRASAGGLHKALARVGGITLLEWNVRQLMRYDFHDIVVAVSSSAPEVSDFARTFIASITCRASISLYEERSPLGNAGAAREVVGDADGVLMVYVDNLASIDLKRLVAFHETGNFTATIATHTEPFQIPFGQLSLTGNRVTGYTEKPVVRVQVSSGTCVLSKEACGLIPRGKPIGMSDLFAILTERGETVGAFQHNQIWIDINDAAALDKARAVFEQRSIDFRGAVVP